MKKEIINNGITLIELQNFFFSQKLSFFLIFTYRKKYILKNLILQIKDKNHKNLFNKKTVTLNDTQGLLNQTNTAFTLVRMDIKHAKSKNLLLTDSKFQQDEMYVSKSNIDVSIFFISNQQIKFLRKNDFIYSIREISDRNYFFCCF